MHQHKLWLLIVLLSALLCVASCDTFQLVFKESRRGTELEHRLRLQRVTRFVPNTLDMTVNTYCSDGNVYTVGDKPGTVVCIKDDTAHIISQSGHQKSQGKILLAIPKVLGHFTNSLIREKSPEKLQEYWFYQNKTCMTGRRDPKTCVDRDGNYIVDATIQRKPCFFVHGVGENGTNIIINSFTDYWGYVKEYMPQCNSFNFLWMDTKSYSWNSDWLNKKVCSLITAGSMKISNSYIFTHSMGGLIMTRALMYGYCQMDKSSSRLFMSQPPLKGSITVNYVNDICKGLHGDLMKNVANYMDYCLPDDKGAYPSYFPMSPDNPELKSVMYAAGVYNDGMLCGNCSLGSTLCGIGPVWQTAGLKAIAVQSNLEFPNDGMVSLDSCQVTNPKLPFGSDALFPYYRGGMNHADGTCRNGDSSMQSLYPCQWFANRYMN